jgi:hypothetical protein
MVKICTKCGREKDSRKDFHKTSRKYETTSGLERIYKYWHAKCRECRNEEKRKYLLERKNK